MGPDVHVSWILSVSRSLLSAELYISWGPLQEAARLPFRYNSWQKEVEFCQKESDSVETYRIQEDMNS